jgi:hypothetical protein
MDDVTARQVPRMRAADADRVATVHRLQDAVARGLLAPGEGSDRMAAAFAAVHLADLAPLTADLPPATTPTSTRATAPGWGPLGLMAWEQVRATVASGSPAVRLVLAAVAALVVLVLLGSLLLQGLFDGGPGPAFDGGWDGRGPR